MSLEEGLQVLRSPDSEMSSESEVVRDRIELISIACSVILRMIHAVSNAEFVG